MTVAMLLPLSLCLCQAGVKGPTLLTYYHHHCQDADDWWQPCAIFCVVFLSSILNTYCSPLLLVINGLLGSVLPKRPTLKSPKTLIWHNIVAWWLHHHQLTPKLLPRYICACLKAFLLLILKASSVLRRSLHSSSTLSLSLSLFPWRCQPSLVHI